MCLHGVLRSIPFNLICNMAGYFQKKYYFDILAHSRGRTEYVFACTLFQLIWYATWLLSEKNVLIFSICLHVAAFVIPFNIIWYTTCHVLKSWMLTFWPHPRVGSMGKIFASMLMHASFPLIWYAVWPYSEKAEFWPLPHPGGHANAFKLKSRLICFISIALLSACEIS